MKIYQIAKGQLVVLLCFTVTLFIVLLLTAIAKESISYFIGAIILFFLALFYSVGWRQFNHKKNNNEKSVKTINYKSRGLIMILIPFLLLILILSIYSIIHFIVMKLELDSTIVQIINVILGMLGVITVVGIFVCVPLGLYFISKERTNLLSVYDERSGKGRDSIIPSEIKGWNWGAAGLTWIWGMCHGVWISLLALIPYIGVVMIIILGIEGNEWAWREQKWESVEKFKLSQKKWEIWGIIILSIEILIIILSVINSIFNQIKTNY